MNLLNYQFINFIDRMRKLWVKELPEKGELNKYGKQLKSVLSEMLSGELSSSSGLNRKNFSLDRLYNKKNRSMHRQRTKLPQQNIKKSHSLANTTKSNKPSLIYKSQQQKSPHNISKIVTKKQFPQKTNNLELNKKSTMVKPVIKKKGIIKKGIKISQLNIKYSKYQNPEECDCSVSKEKQECLDPNNPEDELSSPKCKDICQMAIFPQFCERIQIQGVYRKQIQIQKQKQRLEDELTYYKQQNLYLQSELRSTYQTIKQLKQQLEDYKQKQIELKNQKNSRKNVEINRTETKLQPQNQQRTSYTVISKLPSFPQRSFCRKNCDKVCRCLIENYMGEVKTQE